MRLMSVTPAATTDVREHNLALALGEIRRSQPTSRSAVANATGLAGGTLTSIVPELVRLGLVRESTSTGGKRGRPTRWLEIDGSGYAVIAVEARLDELLLTSVDLAGRTLTEQREERARTALPSPDEIADAIGSAVQAEFDRLCQEKLACVGVSIVIPAPLIGSPPVIMTSTDFGWEDPVDLVEMVRARTTVPPDLLGIVADSHAAAAAEYDALDLATPGTLLYVKADTGVGGALIADGVPFRGGKGVGFVPGHVVVQPDGALCTCGRHGCLVAEVGPEATVTAAGLRELMVERGLPAAFHEVLSRARSGQRLAVEAIARLSRYLQRYTLDLSITFDPDQIVIGGLWADAFDLVRPGDDWDMRIPRLLRESRTDPPRGSFVAPSTHGERAARVGAASYVINDLMSRPSQLSRFARDLPETAVGVGAAPA